MKEKIAQQPVKAHRYNGKTYLTVDGVDQILSLIREKIEKVESLKGMYTKEHEKGFERCRQAILKALES